MGSGGRAVFGIGRELEGFFGADLVEDEGVDGKVPGAIAGGEKKWFGGMEAEVAGALSGDCFGLERDQLIALVSEGRHRSFLEFIYGGKDGEFGVEGEVTGVGGFSGESGFGEFASLEIEGGLVDAL